jgi:hypothetical protein
MRHVYIFVVLMSLIGVKAFAYDANVNGIYYDFSDTEATVTYYDTSGNNYYAYSGNIVIPESVNYNGTTYNVTYINGSAFRYCQKLTSVTIGNNVKEIGASAFSDCTGLTTVIIGKSVTSIGWQAFNGCNSLTSITIGNSVTYIGRAAFSGCKNLALINVPNSVNEIGVNAFSSTAWFENQPDGLVYAGKVAYKYKGKMPENTKIEIEEGTLGIAELAFEWCSGMTSVDIPNSVKNIGVEAFSCCESLTSVSIPNSVEFIGEKAFFQCSSITSVSIGNKLKTISNSMFGNCFYLTSVTIPNSVTSIGSGAFSDCKSLTSVSIPNSVTSIGDNAFFGCSGLTAIIIPNNVTSIGEGAFQSCTSLTSVSIPTGVTSIGSGAFRSCTSLTSVSIPNSVTSIGDYAFSGCSSLESATISNQVTTISNYLFQKCSRLTSINIPNGVTSIGNNAFDGCYSLSNLTIPQSATTIGDYAFQNCRSLATVTIPKDLQIIKRNTFTGCSSLKSITIPEKVEYIYQEAFKGCGLEEVKVLAATPPFAYDNTFSNFNIPLYVPNNSIGKYQTTNPWSKFSSIKKYEDPGGNNESTNVINGHEYIDLDLPSGKCWATTNYGASSPEDYGSYVYWTERNTISLEWGSDWTTPSLQDIRELEDNCTWTWDSKNGHSGYTVTGKNGKSIFLPASGFQMYGQSSAKKVNEWVYYWTSDMADDMAYIIMSNSSNVNYGQMEYNYTKLPIRPITKGGGGNTQPQKCATPSISYKNGQLKFTCATEGVEFVSEITDADIKKYNGATISLTATYNISVYATKSGYDNSETATATLCWIDVEPKTEGITNTVANVRALPLLIQNNGSTLTVSGADDGTPISVYSINGTEAGSAISQKGIATIPTTLQSGSAAIVKVGNKSVKVVMK